MCVFVCGVVVVVVGSEHTMKSGLTGTKTALEYVVPASGLCPCTGTTTHARERQQHPGGQRTRVAQAHGQPPPPPPYGLGSPCRACGCRACHLTGGVGEEVLDRGRGRGRRGDQVVPRRARRVHLPGSAHRAAYVSRDAEATNRCGVCMLVLRRDSWPGVRVRVCVCVCMRQKDFSCAHGRRGVRGDGEAEPCRRECGVGRLCVAQKGATMQKRTW